ncbi:MAG: Stf0 family sulfotransferase, partial [Mangrovicoccus sp.]
RHADGRELERLAPPQAPVYDPKPIARHMQDLTNLEAEWQAWFAREEITPLRLSYEALSENPQACLGHVLGALGQDPASAATIPTPTAKLADQISADWIARFRADHPRA